jgi:hypothetical protein
MAVVYEGTLISLENGRTRREVIDTLMGMASADTDLVVGLDFAFSFPAWFIRQRSLNKVEELWALAEIEGEEWLQFCPAPFWGRPGVARPDLIEHFRCTEAACRPVGGTRPKSVFQIGGAGAVGSGSIRGMPFLSRLRGSGFSVWPFDDGQAPFAIEIYPRLMTGAVRKARAAERRSYLRGWPIPPSLRVFAEETEDAFDAAVSALVMARHIEELRALERSSDPRTVLEGAMWAPPAGACDNP